MTIHRNEILRQIIHILLGPVIVFLILMNWINVRILFYVLIVGLILSLLSLKFNLPIIPWFLRNFERPSRALPGEGILFYFAGSILALKLFSQDIAFASILILSFGDGISHLVGAGLGRYKLKFNPLKKIEGLLAGVIAGTLVAMFFVNFIEAFLASLAAMLVEAAELKLRNSNVDDNLFIPLIAGTVIFLLRTGI